MGWKGSLRSLAAARRRAERKAQWRRRELESQRKQAEKMRKLERAAFEVQAYENHIDVLLSVHRDCSAPWDWEATRSSKPPIRPLPRHTHEEEAQAMLDRLKPGALDTLLGRAESRRAQLVRSVEEAREADETEYREALQVYEQEYADWERTRELAGRVLARKPAAYLDAIRQTDPFSEIGELGSNVQVRAESGRLIEADLHVQSERVIPSEVKSLLGSGRLSVKKMPRSRFYELYQDYVCGCVLRVARELFALLPIEMVTVHALGNLLNPQTGQMEEQPLLSVAIPQQTLEGLDFESLDPCASMSNFAYRMALRKTKGFKAMESLRPADFHTADGGD